MLRSENKRYPFAKTTSEAHAKWNPVAHERTQPTEHMQRLLDAVAKAVDGGLFYTYEVNQAIIENLGDYFEYPDDPGLEKVEGGIRGMEIYYARRALEQRRRNDANRAACCRIQLGMELKNVRINHTVYSTAKVIDVERDVGMVKLRLTKRGSRNRWDATVGASILPLPEPQPSPSAPTSPSCEDPGLFRLTA